MTEQTNDDSIRKSDNELINNLIDSLEGLPISDIEYLAASADVMKGAKRRRSVSRPAPQNDHERIVDLNDQIDSYSRAMRHVRAIGDLLVSTSDGDSLCDETIPALGCMLMSIADNCKEAAA